MLNYMDEYQSCPDAIVAFNSVQFLHLLSTSLLIGQYLMRGYLSGKFPRKFTVVLCYSGDRKSFRIVV